jgi:hypothetical protein
MLAVRPRAFAIAFALLATILRSGPARADGSPPEVATATEEGLRALRSPFLGERQTGVNSLVHLLPGSRDAVLAALPSAPLGVRLLLVEVLSRDDDPRTVGALLELALGVHGGRSGGRTGDAVAVEPVAARVRLLLSRDPERTRTALATWKAGRRPKDAAAAAVAELEALLVRADVERLFLSRKSTTGYTGYYRGQFAILEDETYRIPAVEMCLAILEDRALPVPGLHRAGGYELLNPPRVSVDYSELENMAANAVVELLRPSETHEDSRLVDHLGRILRLKEREKEQAADALTGGSWILLNAYEEKRGEWYDVLLALYLLQPRRHATAFENALDELRSNPSTSHERELYAGLVLRAGRYEEAVGAFNAILRSGASLSPTHLHYNLACAYASWSLEPGDADPTYLREQALRHLERSVREHRWSDLGWMEQDRDLDPIRDTARYRALVSFIRRQAVR